MDLFDAVQQPRCEHCGTVMHEIRGGYACRGCGAFDAYPDTAHEEPQVFLGPSLPGC